MYKIKFRGRTIDTLNWVYGCVWYSDDQPDLMYIVDKEGMRHQVIPETVGQFSGRFDSNSQPIYAGSWVLYSDVMLHYLGFICFGQYEQDGSLGTYMPTDCLGFYIRRISVISANQDSQDYSWLPDYGATISLIEVDSRIQVISEEDLAKLAGQIVPLP